MTTIVQKLLARAAEYEQKAAALKLAAAEMNGQLTVRKQGQAEQTIAEAIALRNQQRPGASASRASGAGGRGGEGVRVPPKPTRRSFLEQRRQAAERRAFLQQFLTTPRSSPEILAELATRGDVITPSRVLQVLDGLKATRHGRGTKGRWSLSAG
jgi:uncharacterized protein YnzC (UPF0291/DUF896 family)